MKTRSGFATVTTFGDDGWGSLQPHPRDAAQSPAPEAVVFHSTAIVDGSRTIEVGCRVRYRIAAGRQGRWEATDVEPVAVT